MTIEIIGVFSHRDGSEVHPAPMSTFDTDFQRELMRAYDRNDYDRILIANGASWPDSLPLAAHVAALSEKVGFMIAHRPGFVAPTMAARMLATIDQLSHGRAAVHVITGGNDAELRADGDRLPKPDRYRRSAEYVDVMRRVWADEKPFDHAGEFYDIQGGRSFVRPVSGRSIPVYWGGMSPGALEAAGRVADVYAFPIATLSQIGELIAKARAAAAVHGRTLRMCMSFRLICADTEDEAWIEADRILKGVVANAADLIANSMANQGRKELAAPHERISALLSEGSLIDKRLWTEITRATNGTRAVTCLVGSNEQIVDALMDYYDLGVTSFLMSGFDLAKDPDYFGSRLIPMLRAAAADRASTSATGTGASAAATRHLELRRHVDQQ